MHAHQKTVQAAFVLSLSTVLIVGPAVASRDFKGSLPAQQPPHTVTEEEDSIQKHVRIEKTSLLIRTAGMTGDRSVIPAMRTALYPRDKEVETQLENRMVLSALHSLAQLGATEALPDVESAMTRADFQDIEKRYARIARARILAEAGDKRPTPIKTDTAPASSGNTVNGTNTAAKPFVIPKSQGNPLDIITKPLEKLPTSQKLSPAEQKDLGIAKAKLDKYLNELSLTVGDLNSIQEKKKQQPGSTATSWLDEELALRELADMIYQKRDVSLVRACEAAEIDFSQDSPAKLKVGLAARSQKERMATLIAWLAQVKALTRYEDYVMQLLINEGTAGSGAAAEQLRVIQKDRAKYNRPQIGGLFRVVGVVGDTAQTSLLEEFLKDKEPGIVHYAKLALQNISSGTSRRLKSLY